MKKFTFSLQSLLGVKMTLEKQQMGELAAAEARVRDLEKDLDNMRLRFQITKAEYTEKLKVGMVPYDITAYAIGFNSLKDKEEAQRDKIRAAEDDVYRIRSVLVETMRERKMLEKLRERHYEEYLDNVKRENEQIIGDFVANQIAAHGNGGELSG